jgi:hypothetical protein
MPIDGVLSALGGFVSNTMSRIVADVARPLLNRLTNHGKEKTNNPARAEIIVAEARPIQAEAAYAQRREQREQKLVEIQEELARYRKAEVAAGLQIAATKAEQENRALAISEAYIDVRRQELELAKQNLARNKQADEFHRAFLARIIMLREQEQLILSEEIAERRELGRLYLEFERQKEANQIKLKLNEIQANWDRENWSGILSREEMQSILLEGAQRHRLLMLASPPDVSPDCPVTFLNNLQKDVRGELKEFLENNYPPDSDCPVEFYGKFFKASVFDTEVKQLERLLAPVPTLIMYSDMTDESLRLFVRFWGKDKSFSTTINWPWEAAKEAMLHEGASEKESLRSIRKAIVKLHQLTAAVIADTYYLAINPNHEPRVFTLDTDLPQTWIDEHFGVLRELQEQIQARYVVELQQAAEQHLRDEEARKRQAAEEEQARLAAELERQRLVDEAEKAALRVRLEEQEQALEDAALGEYRQLKEALSQRQWYEADQITKTLLLREVEASKESKLDATSAASLPEAKLRIVDTLWSRYSEGHFGLTIQRQIYQECQQDAHSFAYHVGWLTYQRSRSTYVTPDYFTVMRYSLSAPAGHLPAAFYQPGMDVFPVVMMLIGEQDGKQ